MKAPRIFITGTDTGVGKTTVGSLLIATLTEMGFCVMPFKPVETGCDERQGKFYRSDTERLVAASKGIISSDIANCYAYKPAVSPHVAAKEKGETIQPRKILERIATLSAEADLLVIEGAGGLLVPLSSNYTFADLALESGASILLIVGSKLGALNHTALTFEAIVSRKLPCLGYVLNEMVPARPTAELVVTAESTNREEIKAIGSDFGIKELDYLDHIAEPFSTKLPKLAKEVIEYFSLRNILPRENLI